ncbi:MAG: ComEC/Rec2 family competence protein [Pseudomonadota bacterium]
MEIKTFHATLNFLTETFAAERDRWFLWAPVLVGCGIASYFSLQNEPDIWVGPLMFGVSFLLRMALHWTYALRILFQALLLLSLGFMVAQVKAHFLKTPMLSNPVSSRYILGDISQVEVRPDGQRITIKNLWIPGNYWPSQELLPEKIRFVLRGKLQPETPLLPGQRISVKVGLNPPGEPVVPGGFDFRRQAYFQGLGAVGFALTTPKVKWERSGWVITMARWRQKLTLKIRKSVPGEAGVIAAALITGDRSGISNELRQSFADAGLAHILAISGLHLSILAGLVFFCIRRGLCLVPRIALDYPIKKWAAAITILITLGYLILCGQSVPATRAFLMTSLIMLAIILDRAALSMHNVAVAAMILLLVFPEVLIGASFQLSFAAVIALIAVYESKQLAWMQIYVRSHWLKRMWLYVSGVLGTSLIASLATAPFGVYHFGRFPLYGILANLVAVPLTTLWVMPMAVLSVIGFAVGSATLPLKGLGAGISVLITIATRVAKWPNAVVLLPSAPVLVLVIFSLGGLWLCLWNQPWRRWGAWGFALAALLFLMMPPPDIYIAGTGKVIGIRGRDGRLWLTTRQASSFLKDSWQRNGGFKTVKRIPRDKAVLGKSLSCSHSVCHYLHNGHDVRFTRSPKVFQLDCSESCLGIDVSALHARGAHAIWLLKGRQPVIVTAQEEVGRRLWSRFDN